MSHSNPFELNIEPTALVPEKKVQQALFFQLNFHNKRPYLVLVDEHGNEIEVDYSEYSGHLQNTLQIIDRIRDRNCFIIDWDRPSRSNRIYLKNEPVLMQCLIGCPNLVDENMNPLEVFSELAEIRLNLTPDSKAEELNAELTINYQGKQVSTSGIYPISENFVIADRVIIEIPSQNLEWEELDFFNQSLKKDQLCLFLSILFSRINYIGLDYLGFKAVHQDSITANPCIIFEKIDDNDALYIRVSQTLPGLDVFDIKNHLLSHYAHIDEAAKMVRISPIIKTPEKELLERIAEKLDQVGNIGKKPKKIGFLQEGNLLVLPGELAPLFIYEVLPDLLETYKMLGAEKLKSYRIFYGQPSLNMNLSHHIDYFEGAVTLNFDGEQIDIYEAINQFRKNRYVLLSDGSHALMNEQYVQKLERLFEKKGKHSKISFFDLPLVEELIQEKIYDHLFEKPKAFFNGLADLENQHLPTPPMKADLRPYQKQGFKWLQYLHGFQLGGCLADDMGLGKTLQCLTLLAHHYQEAQQPTLIIMPKSLLFNWDREIKRFTPQLSTYIFYGQQRDLAEASKANLILSTYAIVRNEIEKLRKKKFFYLVLDESQNIKNVNTQSTKAIMLLQSQHRLALSGTPIENNLGELYSLFRFLNPSMFGNLAHFNHKYLIPIQKFNDQEAARHLRKKIYPFILRRLKKDVLADLPDKTEQTLYVEMSDSQKKFYEQRRQFYQFAIRGQIAEKGLQRSQFFVFQALNELRQIASVPEHFDGRKIENPKLELLMEQLSEAIANGHKALIFVNFLGAIESISKKLENEGIEFVSMTGATRDRQPLVDKFQEDPRCKAFLMTLKTGGTGLNLTAADTIFLYDPWWNVAAENQAIDRAHRIGQVNKVLAFRLITQGTIEEKILQLQDLKRELFDKIISTDTSSMKALTEEDISFILGD